MRKDYIEKCREKVNQFYSDKRAREMYRKLGYKEVGIVPTVSNGIPDVNLVLLEKRIGL